MMNKLLRGLFIVCFVALATAVSAQKKYNIYPVPQKQTVISGHCEFTPMVNVVVEKGIDQATRNRLIQVLEEHGLKANFTKKLDKENANILLGINGSRQVVDKLVSNRQISRGVFTSPETSKKFDRHFIHLLPDTKQHANLVILGEHTNAVFFALASLEQMLDRGAQDLTGVFIEDYADIKDRGVIEGYYGMPYSKAVTQDLLRFMMRYKMNSYMYGAKSDAYHSQYWDKPYPDELTEEQRSMGCFTAKDMEEINKVSAETKVNFIWAIHPGQAFTGKDDNVIDRIMAKFEMMHKLGVRQFAVFVDDVGVPDDQPTLDLNARRLTMLQEAMDKKYNFKGANPADTLKPLHFVPQLYAYGWVNKEKGERFYESLSKKPAKTLVYITGRNVWSVPNNEDIEFVEKPLKADVAWWWNYPCNDNADAWIFPSDMYTNFYDMPEISAAAKLPTELKNCVSLLSNPMQEGELAKIPLFSIADYAWNNSDFNNRASWLAALPAVVGKEYAPVLRQLLPYLRMNDADELGDLIAEYQATGDGHALSAKLSNIAYNCGKLRKMGHSRVESQVLFFQDIRPWLLKLNRMAELAGQIVEAQTMDESDAKTERLAKLAKEVEDLSKNPRYNVTVLEGMGGEIVKYNYNVRLAETYLLPFLKTAGK